MGLKSTSKFISMILRHKQESIGITLDEHGRADVELSLINLGILHKAHITVDQNGKSDQET